MKAILCKEYGPAETLVIEDVPSPKMGVMTGCFGGALRDTLCNEVPFIFRKDQIYASIAFAGCWLYFVCQWFLESESLALTIGLLFIVIVRMAAVRFDIRLQRDNAAH